MPLMSRTSWIAALALAASLLAGCDSKKSSPAPAAEPQAGSPAQPTPPQPTPTPTPAQPQPTPTPAQPTPATPAQPQPAGPGMSSAEAIRKLTSLADRVCACADRACVDAATAAAAQEDGQLAGMPSSAETAAMKAQAKRLFDCQQKLK